jgi:orotidine-5'-phosphate decarboxylase
MGLIEKYNKRADKANSLLCVGLDPEFKKLPGEFKQKEFPQFEFNKYIIDQTAEYAAAFKPNSAFYEAMGQKGFRELKMTMEYLKEKYPDIFTICDSKRGDIGNTNAQYASSVFDWLECDAITMQPYLGKESLQSFTERRDKVTLILVRTSNPGAGEIQDLMVGGKPLWQVVAEKVSKEWNSNGNFGMVMGATYPAELKTARLIDQEIIFLVPGVGAQEGSLEATVKAGLNSDKKGMIINSSRGIIFAEDPAAEARKLRDEINKYRS